MNTLSSHPKCRFWVPLKLFSYRYNFSGSGCAFPISVLPLPFLGVCNLLLPLVFVFSTGGSLIYSKTFPLSYQPWGIQNMPVSHQHPKSGEVDTNPWQPSEELECQTHIPLLSLPSEGEAPFPVTPSHASCSPPSVLLCSQWPPGMQTVPLQLVL